MKVTILGCSNSLGVPVVGCSCSVCFSADIRDKRNRSCAVVETDDGRIVFIDTPPEFRLQVLQNGYYRVSDVIYTHAHADHIHGIDDLRGLDPYDEGGIIKAWSDERTLSILRNRFPNLFIGPLNPLKGSTLQLCELHHYRTNMISGIGFFPFPQPHGQILSNGLIFGNAAYCVDLSDIPQNALDALLGVEVLFIECISYDSKVVSHLNFDSAVALIERIRPKRAFTIHMGHQLSYQGLATKLKEHFSGMGIEVMPSYDGMVVDLSVVHV